MADLRIGTSSFTAAGWRGPFYPQNLPEQDRLSYYATKFDTVEIDSTFYGPPSASTVRGWNAKTPPGFVFAAKVPQVITHDKVLVDCDSEFKQFLDTMDLLGEKLGPILFQFGFFNRAAFKRVDDFLVRLRPFLKALPKDHKFVVEIRNKDWLVPQFIETLREHRVALALIDQSFVAMKAAQWFDRFDPVTANFTYVRWLGDRKAIEELTKVWDRIVVDRQQELNEWADVLSNLKIPIYVYANNHYAGYAPETVELFRNLWRQKGGSIDRQTKAEPEQPEQGQLFSN